MPSRSHLFPVFPALVAAGLLLLAGCAGNSGGRRTVAAARDELASPAGPKDDYSPAGVEARTEAHARYAAAILHDLNEEPGEAAEEMTKAALADLTNEEIVVEASARLLRLKKTDQAIDLLAQAAARPDAPAPIHARLGLAYAMAGKRDLAIESNRKAIKKDPGNLSGYQYLAQLYLQNNQADEGLKVLDEAARQPKADAAYLIDLGETLTMFARAGKMEAAKPRALDAFKRALALKPKNLTLQQRLAEGFAFFGDSEQAARLYTELVDQMPRAPGMRERLVEILIRGQNRTNAIAQLRSLTADNPTSPQFNYLLGTLLFEEKQPKEAIEFLNKAIRFNSNFEPAYHDLAAAQINLKETAAALATLDKARKKFKENFVTEFYTALAYNRTEDYTNALKYFTAAEVIARVKETNRLTPTFLFQLGAAHERTQKFKEAEVYFRRSLDLMPDFAEALNYLGYMWADRGENLSEARTMIEKAVKMEPENSAFLDSLGWVLHKLDQNQEALKHIQKAIEHNDEPDATLYEHLGDIYHALRQPDQARQAFQKAYSIKPSEQIQRKLNAPAAPATP